MDKTDLYDKYRRFYDQKVENAVKKFNSERRKYRNLILIRYIFTASFICLLTTVVLALFSQFIKSLEDITACLGIMSFLMLSISLGLTYTFFPNQTEFSEIDPEIELKSTLMPDFMKIFGNFSWCKKTNNLVYDYNKLQSTMILPKNITLTGDDFISGIYKNVNIKMTEMTLGKMSVFMYLLVICVALIFLYIFGCLFLMPVVLTLGILVGYVTHPYILFALLLIIACAAVYYLLKWLCRALAHFFTVGYFHGVMIEFDMPKKFSGHTFLYENAISSGAIKRKNKEGYERVVLEDTNFNNIWSIYSTNQLEARYILTPAFMERLKNISLAFKSPYLRMSFENNKMILLASAGKDLFAMGSAFKDTDKKSFDILFNEIYSVLELIDNLKLKRSNM